MTALPILETPRLRVLLPGPERAADLLRYHHNNAAFHAPWNPPLPPGFYTEAFWADRLERAREEFRLGTSVRFAAFLRDAPEAPPVAVANFTQCFRGPFQAAVLGYSVDQRHEGRGIMRETLEHALDYMFQVQRYHRIMANHVPENVRSGGLLRRLGFEVEGRARDYLFVGGAWRDHILTARIHDALTAPER